MHFKHLQAALLCLLLETCCVCVNRLVAPSAPLGCNNRSQSQQVPVFKWHWSCLWVSWSCCLCSLSACNFPQKYSASSDPFRWRFLSVAFNVLSGLSLTFDNRSVLFDLTLTLDWAHSSHYLERKARFVFIKPFVELNKMASMHEALEDRKM